MVDDGRDRPWDVGGAVMGMVREQDLFMAIGPAIDFVVPASRKVQDPAACLVSAAVVRAVAGTATVAICFSASTADLRCAVLEGPCLRLRFKAR